MKDLLSVLVAALTLCSCEATAAERAIDKVVVVNAAVDQVWDAWTTRDGIRSFFAPEAVVEPRVGGKFEIQMNPYAPPGERGADDMRYMALQPKAMLSFDWNAPPSLPEARKQRTFVVVRMAAVTDQQTRVTLHHTGWGEGGEWDKAYTYFDRAWGRVLANLQQRFDGQPVDWAPHLARMKGTAEPAAPAGPR